MFNTLEATKKFMIIVILAKLMYSYRASGFIFTTSNVVGCQDSTAKIDFNFDLQGDSIAVGSKVWNLNRSIIAVDTGSGFTALGNYSSRLTNHSSHGLTLSSVTTADAGKYDYDIFLIAGNTGATITTNLAVYVAPTPGCSVYTNQTGDNVTCYINTVNGSCGYPELHPGWVNVTNSSSFICAQEGTYQCCATGPAQTICLPSSSYCVSFTCSPATTTKTTLVTTSTKKGTTQTLVTTSTTKDKTQTVVTTSENNGTDNRQLALIIGISVGVPIVLIIIIVIYCRKQRNRGRNSRKEQDANNHTKIKDATQNPAYGVLNTSNEPYTSDVIQTSTPQQWNNSFLERNEVTKSNSKKAISNPQIQPSTYASNQTNTSHQDWKDKSLPNENEFKETENGIPETTSF